MSILTSRRTLVLAAAAGAVAGRARGQDVAEVVETRSGKVRGIATNGVQSFRGVAYAASTEGANRFLPPQSAVPWSGVREATGFGHSAPQLPASNDELGSWYSALQPVGEDCLSLNVWTASRAGKRPVMVWLHGGAWVSCAGSAPGFDCIALARDGDVVVVTINYRLNLFGYIKLDGSDERFARSGNSGVLDMLAALGWCATTSPLSEATRRT